MKEHRAKSKEQRANGEGRMANGTPKSFATGQAGHSAESKAQGAKNRESLCSEKGIALVMVLVLSAISLGIMAGLLHMLVAGTQTSGLHKRYKTALEASKGGFDVTIGVMELRGDPVTTPIFLALFSGAITTPDTCTGTNMDGIDFTGLEAKFMTSTDSGVPANSWSAGCDSSLTIDPATPTTYDIQFDVGAGPTYTVYAKIVDTVEGNTAPSSDWEKDEFPPKTGSPVYKVPYLYTVEMDAQNATNRAERAKLSVLYQY